MRKIVITGPESSGKTTLAAALAAHYGTLWVREGAREHLDRRGGRYEESTLTSIAKFQLEMEDGAAAELGEDRPRFIICDTDLITIRIWGEEKYGRSDPWIVEQTVQRPYDLWLLCTPDMPWESDPLRESPSDRDRLFAIYERTLQELGKPYTILAGPHELRMKMSCATIDRLLRSE